MYFTPPMMPMMFANGRRTPIFRANPREVLCPIRNINTFRKKRYISASCLDKLQA
jgi:hypothetical protein